MPIHAFEDLDDALAATRAFLWPAERSRWLKLALVAFFVGAPGSLVNPVQYHVPADGGPPTGGTGGLPEIGPRFWLLAGAVVAAALLLGVLFLLAGSIMEFVLVESLRREEVAVRRYWGGRWRQGVRLFGFRLVVGLAFLGSVAALAAPVLLSVLGAGPGAGVLSGVSAVVALLVLLPAVSVLAVLVGLVNGFTTAFVVPIMVLEDCGVLAGWRRLWPTITAHPWQYLAYAVAGFVLGMAGGILVAVATGVAALLLLIPFAIPGAVGVFLLATASPVGIGVLAVVGVLFGLSALAAFALARVPVATYLRYYALLVLGDVDGDLDLVPERRAAVRADAE